MADFLLGFIQVNEEINYSLIISLIAGYLFTIWIIICLWVFSDTRKRYKHFIVQFGITFLVFLLGLPFLIFYIIIRPEHTLEEDYYINMALSGEKDLKPIEFDGNRGFDISFNISVSPKETPDGKHSMNMGISWMPQGSASIGNKPAEVVTLQVQDKKKKKINIKGIFIPFKILF